MCRYYPHLEKGSFLIRSSVDFWNLLISRNATVPGRYLCGFLTPPVAGTFFTPGPFFPRFTPLLVTSENLCQD